METLLALEMVRVTEAAAIASARFMGRGDRHAADRAATEAMRRTIDDVEMHGTIVIGEGERDEAPMLWIGEPVGTRGPGHVAIDIAVDPARGHEPRRRRPGQCHHGARRVREGRPAPRARHVPRQAVRRSGRRGPRGHPRERRPRTSAPSRRRCGGRVARHHGRHPRAAAPRRARSRRSARPARASSSSPTATCRRPSAARCQGTGVHAVMGIGGAPEGVLTAAALRCLGGEIQARFRFRSDEERERAERMGIVADEERVYSHERPRAGRRTSSSRRPASPRATCSTASASSAAAPGRTRW